MNIYLLLRLCLAGLPFIYSLLSVKILTLEDFSHIYQSISLCAVLGISLRFGNDLAIKRRFQNCPDEKCKRKALEGKTVYISRFFIGCVVLYVSLAVDVLWYSFCAFFIYLHFSTFSIQERLTERTMSALLFDPIIMYVFLVLLLPLYYYQASVYFVSITFFAFLYLCHGLFRIKEISIGFDLFSKSLGSYRLHEGVFSLMSVSTGSLLVFYLANTDEAKDFIIAFQVGLVIATVRTLELNWLYKDLMTKVGTLDTFRKKLYYTLLRALFSVFLANSVAAVLYVLEVNFDPVAFVVFVVYEVVCFFTSPFIAYLQAKSPKNTNKGLAFAYFFCFLAVLLSIALAADLTLIVFGLVLIGLSRIFIAFFSRFHEVGIV